MKKTIIAAVICLTLLFSALPSFAAEGDCICGRHYVTSSADENSVYNCEKCGRNFLLCTCDCFCGSEATLSNDENGNTVKICNRCGKTAVECTCLDRETVLRLESMQRDGTLSASGVRFPKTPVSAFLAVLITVGALIFAVFGKQEKKNAEEVLPTPEKEPNAGFENYNILHSMYEELSPNFPTEIYPGDADAVVLSRRDTELFKKALIGEESDISYFLNVISQKLLDSSLFPTEKGLHVAKLLYEKEEDLRIGFGLYETIRLFRNGDRFDARLEQGDKVSVYLSMTAPDTAALLRKCINHRPKRDFELEKTNVTLTKDEFTLFIYIIYSGLDFFKRDGLVSKETVSAFAKKTRGQDSRKFRQIAEKLLRDRVSFIKAFDGLEQKKVLTETEFDVFELRENIKTDFDPEKFRNIVYFEEVENGKATVHINFVLSDKGGVAVFENNGEIKLLSSFTIPWSHYIR